VPDEQCGHFSIKLTKQKRSSSQHALCRVWRSVPRPYRLRADSRCLKIAAKSGSTFQRRMKAFHDNRSESSRAPSTL
jgi:hypothetical protein